MNNILVTGGAGFIGRNLVNKLLFSHEASNTVIVIDNLSNYKEKYPPNLNSKCQVLPEYNKRFVFYKEDIRNTKKISDIMKHERIDTCVHLAAKVGTSESIKDPIETMDVNFKGTLSMLEASSQNKITSFIFASSAAVYGNPFQLPSSEKHPVEPMSPYAASKVAGEALVSSYSSLGRIKNAISLRFFNVYGIGLNPVYAGVITKFARRLLRKLPPLIYGDGTQTRDFISVDDVANCIVLAARAEKPANIFEVYSARHMSIYPRGVLNVGTGIATSINALANKMIKISGLTVKPIHKRGINQRSEVRYSYADTTKASRLLKFKAQRALEDGLEDVFKEGHIQR
jgi:UDP-glucose 4-epimerase